MDKQVIAAFYKFVSLPDYKDLQPKILSSAKENGVKGTILLAEEGINGTVAGTRDGIDTLFKFILSDNRFKGLSYKESFEVPDERTFYRIKVKLKKEIVTIGIPEVSPTKKVGTYIDPKDWNKIIQDPDTIVIDTRNEYETGIGTFKGAIDPHTDTFREFPEYVRKNLDKNKHKKVAMFCTGGIRCEKASSFMLEEGFQEVFHLNGGILKYLEEVPKEESLWDGECFVFDNRVSVDHDLNPGSFDLCHACREPISEEDKKSALYIKGVQCPKCHDIKTEDDRKRYAARQKQVDLAKKRNKNHLGSD